MGLWHWQVHDPVVFMAAELELAALGPACGEALVDLHRTAWSHQVTDSQVWLDSRGADTVPYCF